MKRIQVTVSDDMAKKIENYASSFGVTKSSFCSMMIGQGIINLENTRDIISDLGKSLADNLRQSD